MPVNHSSLVQIIADNKQKKLVAKQIIEANPNAVSVLSKLVTDRGNIRDINNDNLSINKSIFEDIRSKISSSKANNDNITKLFPDIELSIQILVSSILSPKKMTDVQLNYKLDKRLNLNPLISIDLLGKIKAYMNDVYELEDKLPEIVREALFTSGAYVLAIIPEASVDEIINTDLFPSYAVEEFQSRVNNLMKDIIKPINLLKNAQNNTIPNITDNVSTENFINYLTSEACLNITDNSRIFQFSNLKDNIRNSIIKSAMKTNSSIAQESLDKLEYIDIFRNKGNSLEIKDTLIVKQKAETKRKSIGRPMVMKIPTESIIPVFTPGDETNHIGYFVLLDQTGKPISSTTNNNTSPTNPFNPTVNNQISPIQKAYNNLISSPDKGVNVNQLYDIYKNVLEKQLYSSIRNSLYGSNVEIANKNEIYFMMFSRALADQKTNLLFIPKELVIYFTFYYNDIGIGKSLLDNLSILSSLRAILLFSKIMAQSKQAIDVTKVNISLDPNDQDPEKTIEQIQDSVLKLRQNYFPLGINNPADLLNWIQKAGLQFSYENNPLIPNVKIDFENVNLQHSIPNSELETDLRKQSILALGLTPEIIDNGFSPEFATTIVNNNVLLSKRISIYGRKLSKHLSKLTGIVLYNDEELRDIITKEVLEHKSEIISGLSEEHKRIIESDETKFIDLFIKDISDNLIIELPKPENTNLSNLSAEFDLYKENLDKVIESVISTEIFTDDIAGDISGQMDTIKIIFKHHLLRRWMNDNNYYPEVLDLSSNDDDNVNKLLETVKDHLSLTMKNSDKLLSMVTTYKKEIDEHLKKINMNDGAAVIDDAPSKTNDTGSVDDLSL